MSEQHLYRAIIPSIPEGTLRPLWSVMIPNYNSADFLYQALKSVLEQDPGSDLMQIEVVDDCSTKDNPRSLVEELGKGRVGFYQQPQNVGKSKNYETCLKRSRGHLIHILHSDDYVRNGFYSKIKQAFDDYPNIGAAFCREIIMDKDGYWQSISPVYQKKDGVLDNWLEKLIVSNCIAFPSIVVKREVYEKLGGFDERLLFSEDWEMWVRVAANYQVAYVREPLAVYRYKPLELDSVNLEFVRRNLEDMQMCSQVIQSYLSNYLPQATATKLLNLARDNYSLWPVEKISKMLSRGQIVNSIEAFGEIVKCSNSLKTIRKAVFRILKSQIRYSLTQIIP